MFRASSAVALIAILLGLLSTAVAQQQNFIPAAASADFPACGLDCTLLLQAQGSCLPPAAPVTTQFIYESCFCQSALLSSFYNNADGVCDTSCAAESDRQLLQAWYRGLCQPFIAANGGAGSGGTGTTLTTQAVLSTIISGVSTVVVIIDPTAAATSGPTSSGSGNSNSGSSKSGNKSWIDTHWRWILMLGIIIIGLGLLAFVGVLLKRRHTRKVSKRQSTMSSGPSHHHQDRIRSMTASPGVEIWGPHQHMAHTRGWEYNREQDAAMSGATGGVSNKNSKRMKRDQSQRSEKGRSRSRPSEREVDENAPDIVAGRTKSQRKRDRDRVKSRDFEQNYDGRERDSGRSKNNSTLNEKN